MTERGGATPTAGIEGAARRQETFVRETREALHRIPELRFEEEETLALIRRELDRLAGTAAGRLRVREQKGGLVADLDPEPGAHAGGGRRLFRADVDGLPVPEGTGLPYASVHPGKMHACGHDAHAAMLLGALRALLGGVRATHPLRLVWQRAEENPVTESGGAMLVREGVCEGVGRVYGLHVDANAPAGRFACRSGPHMANSDRVRIEISCPGGHVARPQHGSNAADVAVDVCVALRGFPLRVLGPLEPVSFVPAVVQAGSASNVRPDRAELWFAARNFLDAERRARFHARVREEVEGVVRRYADARVTVSAIEGHPSLVNTPAEVERTRALLEAAGLDVTEEDLRFGGEDFAWYLRARPGCFWFLGAHQAGSGDHHAPRFNPDPAVLWRGVHYWLLLATEGA